MTTEILEKKELIKKVLRSGICELVFTKKNGDERQMTCTLHPDHLPLIDKDAPAGKSPENEETVVVWDTEAQGWRQFRLENLVSGPWLIG